ncbi:AraC family transcriptional regulator [Cohnella endophytica]|uniref:AraC family transcriptional regulator n=1 Tax=Cohnella endophytica TaxID=2419778 RepID=A0A494XR21_9BACL|nr:AraC family transcriptional regulator [Cohnella endophytica]RKP53058.1 AraC family transcriptional regulator [Cohnella endophytica]
MKRSVETFRSDQFFHERFPLYVNRATENFDLPMHNHDFIEFSYVAEGSGFHHIGGEVREAVKGQLFFIPIGTPHVFRPASTNAVKHTLIVFNCVFSPVLLGKLAGFSSDPDIQSDIRRILDGKETHYALRDPDDAIGKLFLLLHREYALPRQGTTDYLISLLLQLFVAVHRLKSQTPSPATRKFDRFEHLLAYMESRLSEPLTLSHLAEISLWSERHLQRLFLRHASQPFHRYLQSLRVERSRELLRSTSLAIGSIAEAVGYKDIASFISVFKRNAGQTPSAYRKAAGAALEAMDVDTSP